MCAELAPSSTKTPPQRERRGASSNDLTDGALTLRTMQLKSTLSRQGQAGETRRICPGAHVHSKLSTPSTQVLVFTGRLVPQRAAALLGA